MPNKDPSILVLFSKTLPQKEISWWKQFNTIVAPQAIELDPTLSSKKIHLETLVDPGSVEKASSFLRDLSLIKTSSGGRLSKAVTYRGFELWWIHYDDLMFKFCLPYTQYERLLEYLRGFSSIYIYNSPHSDLFEYFFMAYHLNYKIEREFGGKLSLGIILQVILSALFLFWAKSSNAKLMVWSSDFFDPPRDHDFRMRYIYSELRDRRLGFIEFIRSMESSKTILGHAWKRKRPVIYSFAISRLFYYLGNAFTKRYKHILRELNPSSDEPVDRFRFSVASTYLQGAAGDIWAIRSLEQVLRFLGTRAAIIPAAMSRNFLEVLACKICDIKTVGILHGASSKDYNVYDFMPGYDGHQSLSLDKYGLWSEWWREYYLRHSRVYKPEQLFVAGLMRPFIGAAADKNQQVLNRDSRVRVLLVSEQLADPGELLPYLQALIEDKDIHVYITFRPYRDGFEGWLKLNHPEILDRIGSDNTLHGNVHESISICDVVIGCSSTGVIEAALQVKPFVFFYTQKWGDYFQLRTFGNGAFFAENPQELVSRVKKSTFVSAEVLKKIQKRFFGDPHLNGSKWVVEEAQKFIS